MLSCVTITCMDFGQTTEHTLQNTLQRSFGMDDYAQGLPWQFYNLHSPPDDRAQT